MCGSTNRNSILCECGNRTLSHDADPTERMMITDAVRQVINKAYSYNNNLIITGDFKYKNINWEHQHAINVQSYLLDFICTIQDRTHKIPWKRNSKSTWFDFIKWWNYDPGFDISSPAWRKQKEEFIPINNVLKTNYKVIKET